MTKTACNSSVDHFSLTHLLMDETNVIIFFLFGTKDSIITILVANYNNKNNNNNKNGSSSSNNTTTYLATHDFNLLYSRRRRPKPNDNNNDDDDGEGEEEEEEFIATLISINPISGILEAKIEPSASRGGGRRRGGKTHEEAFAAFKRYVEVILGEVLKSVPDVAATTVSSSLSEITIEQQQPPPAYEVGRNALSVEGGGGIGKF